MCTSLRQSLWSLNRGCQTCTSLRQSLRSSNEVRERLLAFDSLWTGLVIVTSNVYTCNVCVIVLLYRSSFRTIPLIVWTPPLFREKSLIYVFLRIRTPEMKSFHFVRIIRLITVIVRALRPVNTCSDWKRLPTMPKTEPLQCACWEKCFLSLFMQWKRKKWHLSFYSQPQQPPCVTQLTHLLLPVPRFLWEQNLPPKCIISSDMTRQKLHDNYIYIHATLNSHG